MWGLVRELSVNWGENEGYCELRVMVVKLQKVECEGRIERSELRIMEESEYDEMNKWKCELMDEQWAMLLSEVNWSYIGVGMVTIGGKMGLWFLTEFGQG